MIFRTNILGSLIGIVIAVVGLTSCESNNDNTVPPGPGLGVHHALEIHFVKESGEQVIDCLPHETAPCLVENGLTFFRSSDIYFHEYERDNSSERCKSKLLIVDAADDSDYLLFSAISDKGTLSFRHYFHSSKLFDYKSANRAVMTSHWRKSGWSGAECVGVTFEGKDYPVAPSRYYQGCYQVTIALPEAGE